MRLTCPNCEAQYEVPDDVIPETGRDVQCSNCAETWFQPSPDQPLPSWEADEPADTGPDDSDAAVAPTPRKAAEHSVNSAPEAAAPAESTEQGTEGELPARREIAPSVASILRAEAELEQRARAAAQGGLEVQPGLGLGEGVRQPRPASAVLPPMDLSPDEDTPTSADATIEEDMEDSAEAPEHQSLYPAVEEVNAPFAPAAAPQATIATHEPPRPSPAPDSATAATPPRRGFRSGFFLAVLIAVILLLLYMFATQLAEMFPALGNMLAGYTAWVDGLRQWLETLILPAGGQR